MFISGLGQDYPIEPQMPAPSTGGWTGIDWSGMLKTGVQAYKEIETARAQADAARAAATPQPYPSYTQYPLAARSFPAGSGLSPFPGIAGFGAGGTLLVLGAGALAVWYLIRK